MGSGKAGGSLLPLSMDYVPLFTAGVGENSPTVLAAACEALEFLGLKLDLKKND
jgi:acetate kinase